MPKAGVEPAQPCDYQTLNLARLPVPPLRQLRTILSYRFTTEDSEFEKTRGNFHSVTSLKANSRCLKHAGLSPYCCGCGRVDFILQNYLSAQLWSLRQPPQGLPFRQGRLTQGCLLCRASRQVLCSHQ